MAKFLKIVEEVTLDLNRGRSTYLEQVILTPGQVLFAEILHASVLETDDGPIEIADVWTPEGIFFDVPYRYFVFVDEVE